MDMNRPYSKALPTTRLGNASTDAHGNGHHNTRYREPMPDPALDAGLPLTGTGGTTHPNLFKLVHRLLRGRYILTLSLAGAMAIVGAIFGFSSTHPMYRTTGTVSVQSQLPGGIGYGGGNSMAFIATQAALMQNDRVLQQAMEHEEWKALGLGTGPEAQETLRDSLDISQVPGSTDLLYITSTARSSDLTKAAVKSILQAFSNFGQTDDARALDATTSAYRDRKNQIERTIKDAKEQLIELSKDFGTTDLSTIINQKRAQIADVDAQIAELETRLSEMPVGSDPAAPTPLTPDRSSQDHKWSPQEIARVDPTMKAYVDAESNAASTYEALRQRFSEQHVAVKRAADDLAKIRIRVKMYADQWTPSPDLKEHAQVLGSGDRKQIEQWLSEKRAIKEQRIEDSRRMNETQIRITAVLDQIKRDESRLAEIQANIDALNMRAQIAIETNPTGRMRVVSDGSTPLKPSVDRRKQYAAAGFVLGGGLPVAFMLLLGLMDRRFRYSDDANETGITAPLLGILPILPPDVRDEERRAMAAHCVHNIRVLLQLSGEVGGAKVFAVTSPTAGDGKTSLVLSLGLSFAASGSRTILVDFDTVGTGLSASLDARGGPGVLDAIRTGQVASSVQTSGVDDNLFIIPSTPGDDIHVSRVSTSSVRRLIATLRDQFDVVLIDTGPILGSIEASLAAAQADGVVLVVGRGQHHTYVKRAIDRITAVGGRLAGMVFNRATASDFRRSVSAASVRSIPRGLPAGPSSRGSGGLANAGPIASTVVRGMEGPTPPKHDHRHAR